MMLLVFVIFLNGVPDSVASESYARLHFRLNDSRLHSSASASVASQCEKKISNCACQTDQGLIDLSIIDSKDPKTPKFQDDDPRGEFRYYYNPCTPFNYGQCKGAAVCRCSKFNMANCYVIGSHAKDKFLVENDRLNIVYSEITTSVLFRSHVSLVCGNSDDPDADFELVDSGVNNDFYFTLTTLHACPKKKMLSTGTFVVIAFGCLVFVYFVGGILCKRFIGKERGYKMIPNHKFWLDFPGLVRDGVIFICCCSTPQPSPKPEQQRGERDRLRPPPPRPQWPNAQSSNPVHIGGLRDHGHRDRHGLRDHGRRDLLGQRY